MAQIIKAPDIRVAIVDDHESVRVGLHAACNQHGYPVVAISATIHDLKKQLHNIKCHVVILDLALADGSHITDNIKLSQSQGAAVLIHTIADHIAGIREALSAGAAGIIPKSAPIKTVMDAITTVANGQALNNIEWATAIDTDRDFVKAQLARRERDVLHLYASGLPLKIVAAQLGIAPSTAREYLNRIRNKYGEIGRPAPTKIDLLYRAVEDGILPAFNFDQGNG
jgi:two-component system uhpT operon response regulator UhpA